MDISLSIREIEYVLTVASEKSITKAAQKLYIAQPSLSQAIIKIESRLGIKLFNRKTGQIYPTSEGELFIKMGKRILQNVRSFDDDISSLSNLESGEVVIGIPYLFGSFVIPEIVKQFHERYPNIKIHLVENNSQTLENKIQGGEVDLAIMALPFQDKSIQYEEIFSSRMLLVVSKSAKLNKYAYDTGSSSPHKYFNLSNAAEEPFIVGVEGQRIRLITQLIFHRAGINPPISLYSKNIETIRRMAVANLGLAILPEQYIFDNIRGYCKKGGCWMAGNSDANYYYLPESEDVPWVIVLAYSDKDCLSNAAKHFSQTVHDYCSTELTIPTFYPSCQDDNKNSVQL